MKIAIDGSSLDSIQGTGLATYSKELTKLLTNRGHEVWMLYGLELKHVSHHLKTIGWTKFLQNLARHDEMLIPQPSRLAKWMSLRGTLTNWMSHFTFIIKHYLGLSVDALEIFVNPDIDPSHMKDHLPTFARLFNAYSLYRYGVAMAILSDKPTYIKLPTDTNVDLLHLTSPLPISMKGVKKIVTLHDIFPIVCSHLSPLDPKYFTNLLRAAFSDADLIFSISEHSKRDLIHALGIPEEKIHVTYQAMDIPEFYSTLSEKDVTVFLQKHFDLKRKEYFLFYGVEPRKNIKRVLEAFLLSKSNYPLVIVGQGGWLYKEIMPFFEHTHSDKALFKRIPYTSFQELMYLLKGARGLIFPSLYEGFGLPVLEAMLMGCPVITSKVSALPEVGGEAVAYVNPLDIKSIADAIAQFSVDTPYLLSLTEKGYKQAEKFSPERHLEKVEAGYKLALGH